MNGAVSNGRDAIGRPYRTHLIQTVSKALMRKSFEIVVSDPDMRAWYFQGCGTCQFTNVSHLTIAHTVACLQIAGTTTVVESPTEPPT